MKIWKSFVPLVLMLVLMWSVPAAYPQSPAPQKISVEDSAKSVTHAAEAAESKVQSPKPQVTEQPPDGSQRIINACAAAAEDLKATRAFANGLETENKLLYERLETEKRTTAVYAELNATRRAETDALRDTIDAKNETIAAKNAAIAKQDQLTDKLKQNKSSPWRRLGDILTGVAIFAILK